MSTATTSRKDKNLRKLKYTFIVTSLWFLYCLAAEGYYNKFENWDIYLTGVVLLFIIGFSYHKIKTGKECTACYFIAAQDAKHCPNCSKSLDLIKTPRGMIQDRRKPRGEEALRALENAKARSILSYFSFAAVALTSAFVLLFGGFNLYVGRVMELSPLAQAANEGNLNLVKELVEKGAAVEQTNDPLRTTALTVASRKGHTSIVELLLSHGAKPNHPSGSWNSAHFPLTEAARTGQTEVVKLLLKHGARIDVRDAHGDTALHKAARNGDHALLKVLIANRAPINEKNVNNRTAVMEAAKSGHHDIVLHLLKHGANLSALDNEGESALSLAKKFNHHQLVQELSSHEKKTRIPASTATEDLE